MIKKFYKMHGIGNDYVYFDAFDGMPKNPGDIAVRLSDRHKGIGSDGVIFVTKSVNADGGMKMYNADGSEGLMCGNGIRCVAKFLYEIKGIKKDVMTIQTRSGLRTVWLTVQGGEVQFVKVDMGIPEFAPQKIPALFDGDRVIDTLFMVGTNVYRINCVSMGNPHCVVFSDPALVLSEGAKFERHRAFPAHINTEFVRVDNRNELTMRVWERGSGETLACGTGACAAAVMAILNGYCDEDAQITVHLLGGDLQIVYTHGTVYMTGSATLVYTGEVDVIDEPLRKITGV